MSEDKKKPVEDHLPTYGWSQMENLKKVEELPKKMPEPYTVPEGYVPPSMKELWQYAQRRHPYGRYGYALAFLVGLSAYAAVTIKQVEKSHNHSKADKAG